MSSGRASSPKLILATVVITALSAVIMVLFFDFSLPRKERSAVAKKHSFKSLLIARSGANHALLELRKRVRKDLKDKVSREKKSSVFDAYVANSNSLGFLRDFAYAEGDAQFLVFNGKATLDVSALNIDTWGLRGSYTSRITIEPNGNPAKPNGDTYVFYYKFMIDSSGSIVGTITALENNIRLTQGAFAITVKRDNFAKYALFTNHHKTLDNSTVWFSANTNFTGPVHTNERYSFANNPSAAFAEEVTQHLSRARFFNIGDTILADADSNYPYDLPTFRKGFQRARELINLPSSAIGRDLKKQALGGLNDDSWANGIYVPNQAGSVTGGIYVLGDVDNLVMGVDANNRLIFTITVVGNTKSVTVDYVSKKTIVVNIAGSGGTDAGTYSGIPDGIDHEGLFIYVNGQISGLSGIVQKDSQVTVSGEGDIVINYHIVYEGYNPGSPPNALGFKNLLGILSLYGNVRIGRDAPDDLNIHAIVMAAGSSGIFTVDEYDSGPPRGIVTLLGGAITDFYGPFGTFWGSRSISGYGRNFVYDSRMLQGIAPPYFSYLSTFASFDDRGLDRRLIWQDKEA